MPQFFLYFIFPTDLLYFVFEARKILSSVYNIIIQQKSRQTKDESDSSKFYKNVGFCLRLQENPNLIIVPRQQPCVRKKFNWGAYEKCSFPVQPSNLFLLGNFSCLLLFTVSDFSTTEISTFFANHMQVKCLNSFFALVLHRNFSRNKENSNFIER